MPFFDVWSGPVAILTAALKCMVKVKWCIYMLDLEIRKPSRNILLVVFVEIKTRNRRCVI